MKKIVQCLSLAALAFGFASCNDKLEIAAPYKNITVVYGLLNPSDTAHYVRIQKAFMDQNQSAIDMAKVADSSFYSALDVKIKEINPAGIVINTISLNKVDLKNEGYPKDSGAFFNTPSFAYKFKYNLNKDNQYRLVILNTSTGNVDSSVTNILDNSGPFTTFGLLEWQVGGFQIGFAKILSDVNKPLGQDYTARIPAKVGAAELILRFNWTDSNLATKTSVRHSADFKGFTFKDPANRNASVLGMNFDLICSNKDIYDFLNGSISNTSDPNVFRYMDSCDMFLYIAGEEFKRYQTLNTNNGGLTADEIRPMYSNIKGKDVMGLFTTRTFAQRLSVPISSETRDSLQTNFSTRDKKLRFYP